MFKRTESVSFVLRNNGCAHGSDVTNKTPAVLAALPGARARLIFIENMASLSQFLSLAACSISGLYFERSSEISRINSEESVAIFAKFSRSGCSDGRRVTKYARGTDGSVATFFTSYT